MSSTARPAITARSGALLLALTLVVAACVADTSPEVGGTVGTPPPKSPPAGVTTTVLSPSLTTSPPVGSETPSSTTVPATDPPPTRPPSPTPKDCPRARRPAPVEGPSARSVELSDRDPRVRAVVYPLPDYPGDPWTTWGQGLVLPDGRFVSAAGDHLGIDGNAWFFVYDPATDTLTRVRDVLGLVDHQAGTPGHGKVHAQMVGDGCGTVWFATYWGSRDGITAATYAGGFVGRWDTIGGEFEALGVPVPTHGIPSLAGWIEGGVLYGEAVDPLQEGKNGPFFVYDLATGETTTITGPHAGFRSILVDAEGRAWFSGGGGSLRSYDPRSGEVRTARDDIPGKFLRAATRPASDGTVYGVTKNPAVFFALEPDGRVRTIAPARDYTASIVLSADERRIISVPGAHGAAWEYGTPVVAVDVETGREEILVELNDLAERRLGLRLGGTYSVALDRASGRLYLVFNAGAAGEESFGRVVLVIVDLPEDLGVAPPPPGDDPPADDPPPGDGSSDGPGGTEWSAPTSGRAGPIRLTDATATSGLVEPLVGLRAHAAALADVNGDGWSDLVVGTFADRPPDEYRVRGAAGPAPDRLLLGGPDGFTPAPGFPGARSRTSGLAAGDLDGDGDLDLVVGRNLRQGGRFEGTVVLENLGVGFAPPIVVDARRGVRSIAPFDYDGDGDLDLFLVEDRFTGASSVLLRNDGGLRFTDATDAAGLPRDVQGLGVAAVDLTGDGLPEIFVGGSNRLFVARGGGRYREASASPYAWSLYGPEDDPAGVAVADLNGDGRLDLVVGQHYNSTIDFGRRVPVRLYLNEGTDRNGDPRLRDVTEEAGLVGLPTKAPHVEIADLDNDGLLDLVTTASAGGGTLPAVFRNLGARGGVPRFEAPEGLGDPQYWVSGSVADVDHDGRVEIFLAEWEPSLPSVLVRNEGPVGHWIAVGLDRADGTALGAEVRVYEQGRIGERGGLIGARPLVGSLGYGAGTAPVARFGLGDRTGVDLEIVLPHDRGVIRVTDVGVDRLVTVEIEEGNL